MRYGADDYFTKPISVDELLTSIENALQRRKQDVQQRKLLSALRYALESEVMEGEGPAERPSRILKRGYLVIDLARHRITIDDVPINLSPTECDILVYLAKHAPRVISPQELVREVQGYESEIWEARDIMRYHIYRIRRKIEKATGRTDVIKTVRGVGYALNI